jgi:hypothetical protein
VSVTAITGTGSIRQKRLPNGKPFGLGCDRCERRLNKGADELCRLSRLLAKRKSGDEGHAADDRGRNERNSG